LQTIGYWVNFDTMKRLFIVCTCLLAACTSQQGDSTTGSVLTDSVGMDKAIRGEAWPDSLVMDYIEHTNSQSIKYAKQDTAGISWIYEGEEVSDTATYLMVRIGRSLEFRFVTDAWLYIDKNKKVAYEYDVAGDSLINDRKLRFLFFANGGLLGFYSDGTVAGCPHCDLLKSNIEAMSNEKPHAGYTVGVGYLVLDDGEKMVLDTTLEFREWAMVDYKWVVEPE
jgi:hypothetical protein